MQCPRCGTDNLETNVYCANCGGALRPVPAEAAVPGSSYVPAVPPPPPVQPVAQAQYTPPPPYQGGQPSAQPIPGWHAPPGYPQSGGRSPVLPQFGSLAPSAANAMNRSGCGVCGTALFAGQTRCGRCQTPPGAVLNPNDPTATSFLPFGPHVPLVPLFRAGEDRNTGSGEQIGGWNWAAALVPTIWATRHRITWLSVVSGSLSLLLVGLYLLRAALHRTADAGGTLTGFLIACTLIFALPRSLYLGLQGNTLAWRSGLYNDREQLRKSQRSGTVWAIIGVTVLVLLLGVVAAILNSK